MAQSAKPRPLRALLILLIALIGLGVWTFWPGTEHNVRLGLDLQGGTQVTLVPHSESGQDISDDQLNQAVQIIRQRVNAFGVSEAEVTTQGSGGSAAIVVSVPGSNQQDIANQISTTAKLDFRPVIQEEASGATPAPEPTAGEPTASPSPSASKTKNKPRKGSNAGSQATPAPSPSPSASGSPAPDTQHPPIQSPDNNAALQAAFAGLNCADPVNTKGGTPDKPEQWLVTCQKAGLAKYLLEPAFIQGTQITDAQAQLPQQGGGGWQVTLTFDAEGTKALADVSSKLVGKTPPQNQFAIVLDGLVQSSPYFSEAILGGQAQINGNFTAQEAQDLANVLRYGALPVQLTVAEVTSISPTLGSDQLKAGLLAGGIGLALVMLYLLFYYRALGVVAIVSLFVSAYITYCLFVIMGRTIGLALTLAGVAGAIVAIGITADSFVVYFERIRDEVRDGRSLRVAVEQGWHRARNTILAADFVSLLAAGILYYVTIGNVRGFAFVLGITTLIDILVAFMFTKPLVTLLASTKWFASGGSLTGMSMKRIGVNVTDVSLKSKAEKKSKQPVAAGGVPEDEVVDETATPTKGEES